MKSSKFIGNHCNLKLTGVWLAWSGSPCCWSLGGPSYWLGAGWGLGALAVWLGLRWPGLVVPVAGALVGPNSFNFLTF